MIKTVITAMIAFASILPAGNPSRENINRAIEYYNNTAVQAAPAAEASHTWCITKKVVKLSNGCAVGRNTYMRILRENPSRDYYTVQWYDSAARLNKSDVSVFTATPEVEEQIVMKKTAGVITA